MAVRVRGFVELEADLDSVPERARAELPKILGRAGMNIKADWRARWAKIQHHPTHIPHLLRGIGYDVEETPKGWGLTVGVAATNRQAFLAEVIERGTLTSPPHPGPVPALETEVPKFERALLDAAAKLLEPQ